VPRLIHLNGPSGIGKSTIARSYAERHPGVLNLDTDRVVCLIGGWQDTFFQTVVDDVVQERGGTAMVERIHDQLTAYLPQRPRCAVVPTDGLAPEATYEAVLAQLRAS
jgi:predicted ABC-type ATPase